MILGFEISPMSLFNTDCCRLSREETQATAGTLNRGSGVVMRVTVISMCGLSVLFLLLF